MGKGLKQIADDARGADRNHVAALVLRRAAGGQHGRDPQYLGLSTARLPADPTRPGARTIGPITWRTRPCIGRSNGGGGDVPGRPIVGCRRYVYDVTGPVMSRA